MLHIFLVEDLASEREIIATAFEHRGVRVSAFATDAAAYDALGRHGLADVAAIVTDVNLGRGTTGFDVARAARQTRSDIAVVYMTAYDLSTAPHEVPDSLTLKKPLRLTEVADQVIAYLQRRDAADEGARGEAARA